MQSMLITYGFGKVQNVKISSRHTSVQFLHNIHINTLHVLAINIVIIQHQIKTFYENMYIMVMTNTSYVFSYINTLNDISAFVQSINKFPNCNID